MPKMIFVNLPVKDLAAATRFYEAIGCTRTNSSATTRRHHGLVRRHHLPLLTRDFFATFTPKPVAEAQKTSEVLLALTLDSREEVDAIVEAAQPPAARPIRARRPIWAWLYNRAFEDPDGHIFEAVWVDMAAVSATGE